MDWSDSGVKWMLWLALAIVTNARGWVSERSFWIWTRTEPLSNAECAQLHAQGVQRLFWKVAIAENRSGIWKWQSPPIPLTATAAPGFQIIPVIRLEASIASPFADEKTLLGMVETVWNDFGRKGLQIDYDCPDRLLPAYAQFLGTLHRQIPDLSATALAGWANLASFSQFQEAVSETAPMFYDLEPDTAATAAPLVDPKIIVSQIQKWADRSHRSWLLGLPWFARLTVYDSKGQSLGNIPRWSWDDVCFNRALSTTHPTKLGMTVMKAESATSIGPYAVARGDTVVARWPDLDSLVQLEKTWPGRAIYFRLPDDTAESGWSLRQFDAFHVRTASQLRLQSGATTDPGDLELINDSDCDLPPRLSGEGPFDRGYALEVDAAGPIFRDVERGDFWRVVAHQNPDTRPVPAPLELATRLTFWFSYLPARGALHLHIYRLAPGATVHDLRYRILNLPTKPSWSQVP